MIKRNKEGVYLIESDRHFPYECKAYSSIVLQVVQALGKDLVGFVNIGDLLDNPQCSTHLKDPRRMAYIDEDIEKINDYLDNLESVLPAGASMDMLEGNHEDRIRKYTLRQAQAISSLISTLPKEYCLSERTKRANQVWQWHKLETWNGLTVGNTVIHHGHYFDRHTAISNLQRYCSRGYNFVQGHTHRAQLVFNDRHFSMTIGHGSNEVHHEPVPTEHRKAFALLTVYKGGTAPELITVDDGRAIVRGKVFKG